MPNLIPPEDAASIARARKAVETERRDILKRATSCREAAVLMLDFYPEALDAIRAFIDIADRKGFHSMSLHVEAAAVDLVGSGSLWDRR